MILQDVSRLCPVVLVLVLVSLTASSAQQGATSRVSVSTSGVEAAGRPYPTSISADGRYVVFDSDASNLVAGDTNGVRDTFVRDRLTGVTTRISVSSAGQQGNDRSNTAEPVISADGRFVAFSSLASNLVDDDTLTFSDVFVHDRVTGQTTRVSTSPLFGGQALGHSSSPAISADGRYIAFFSTAGNIVPGDTNLFTDIFVSDRQTLQTVRVSVSTTGVQGNDNCDYHISMTPDGRFVAFVSAARNLVPSDISTYHKVFVRDVQASVTTLESVSTGGIPANDACWVPKISGDGRFVAFLSQARNLVAGDSNGSSDVFVRDRQSGITSRVSVSSTGVQGNEDSNIGIAISADGRFVAFSSLASNLVVGDTNSTGDVFVRDRYLGVTSRVSLSTTGLQGNGWSGFQDTAMSADGRYIAFGSWASNLVQNDSNGVPDVFVHQFGPGTHTVSGSVILQDLSPLVAYPSSCTVDFRNGSGSLVISRIATLDTDGNFTVSAPDECGPFWMAVKHRHWLRKVIGPIDTSFDVIGVVFQLRNGDCDGDNEVGIGDYSILSSTYGRSVGEEGWNYFGDLNEDATVDIADYAILSTSYGEVGDE